MSAKFKFCLRLNCWLLVFLCGCSTYQPAPPLGSQEWRDSFAVLVQVCLVDSSATDRFAIFEVDRYGPRGEMRSEGPMSMKVMETIPPNRVVEGFSHRRQIDLVSILVYVGQTTYVFDVTNKNLTSEEWSPWEQPLSMNDPNEHVWHKLAHQQSIPIHQPSDSAPRARYRLVRTSDWWDRRPRQNDDRPSCN